MHGTVTSHETVPLKPLRPPCRGSQSVLCAILVATSAGAAAT
jgi:hypothetical protein